MKENSHTSEEFERQAEELAELKKRFDEARASLPSSALTKLDDRELKMMTNFMVAHMKALRELDSLRAWADNGANEDRWPPGTTISESILSALAKSEQTESQLAALKQAHIKVRENALDEAIYAITEEFEDDEDISAIEVIESLKQSPRPNLESPEVAIAVEAAKILLALSKKGP